jgi:hypothetical protein
MYSCFSFDKFFASLKSLSHGEVPAKRNGKRNARIVVFIFCFFYTINLDSTAFFCQGALMENMVG